MTSTDSSFSAKIKAGWSKADLMKHYAMTENEYQRVHECVQTIQKQAHARALV